MDVSIEQIHELIRQGEGISVEFKTCRNKINRDVYETVCAFLNRHGGTILLGVQDDGTLQGIEPDAVSEIKKDFHQSTTYLFIANTPVAFRLGLSLNMVK